jgi:hypothetical protein
MAFISEIKQTRSPKAATRSLRFADRADESRHHREFELPSARAEKPKRHLYDRPGLRAN